MPARSTKDLPQKGFRPFFAFLPNGDLSIVPAILATSGLALSVLAVTLCEFILLTYYSKTYSHQVIPREPDSDEDIANEDLVSIRHFFFSINRRNQCNVGVLNAPYYEFGHNDNFNGGGADLLYADNPDHWYFDPDYSEQTYDAFRNASIFGWTAVVLGGMIWQFLVFGSCIAFRRCILIVLGLFCMLTALMEGLTLLAFGADMCEGECLSDIFNKTELPPDNSTQFPLPLNDDCSRSCAIAPGAGCAITSMVLWLTAGIVMLVMRPANGEEDDSPPADERDALLPVQEESNDIEGGDTHISEDEEEVEVGPTKTSTTKITYDKNGNKIITRTFES